MLRMTVSDIARATGAAVLLEGARDVAGEVVVDSREAGDGRLFVAFPGERVDGNAYLASAARTMGLSEDAVEPVSYAHLSCRRS